VVPVGVNGINITTSDVTLDLNGFSITAPNYDMFLHTLVPIKGVESVTVRNGNLHVNGRSPFDIVGTFSLVFEDLTLTAGGSANFGIIPVGLLEQLAVEDELVEGVLVVRPRVI